MIEVIYKQKKYLQTHWLYTFHLFINSVGLRGRVGRTEKSQAAYLLSFNKKSQFPIIYFCNTLQLYTQCMTDTARSAELLGE